MELHQGRQCNRGWNIIGNDDSLNSLLMCALQSCLLKFSKLYSESSVEAIMSTYMMYRGSCTIYLLYRPVFILLSLCTEGKV